jgi:D-alanyl-D-alanine carboxypeptidase
MPRLSCSLAVPFALALATCALGLRAVEAGAPLASETIESIDKIVAEGIDQKKVASYAIAVVRQGEVILTRGYGLSDLENDVPATAETIYRLGSITKQFTALAIMQLAEQGKLSVDDELTKFLPEYPTAGHKVTVHHLLNHTSGIKSYTSKKDFFARSRLDLSHDELLALFKDEPFDFEPGAKWLYNNSGYYLLGMIIEKASGQSYAKYLEEHVFNPLGMSATRYGDMQPIIRHRAMGYKRSLLGQLINDDPMSMNAPGAAGALVSNVLDLAKWHQALEAGKLVSAASYEAMYRKTKLVDSSERPYGYGWGLGELLSNTAGANVGQVENRIAKLLLGVEDKPIVDLPIDAGLLERLTGKYRLGESPVEITVEDGKLFAVRAAEQRNRLKYQGQTQFISADNPELRFTFTPADGKATGFELDVQGEKRLAERAE